MRKCKVCGIDKDINQYYLEKQGYRKVACKDCEKKRKALDGIKNRAKYNESSLRYDKKKREENRQLIDGHKKSNPCSVCGETDIRCLDFHHIDPNTKLYDFGRLRKKGYATKTVLTEIAKCVILCANCHRKHHKALL